MEYEFGTILEQIEEDINGTESILSQLQRTRIDEMLPSPERLEQLSGGKEPTWNQRFSTKTNATKHLARRMKKLRDAIDVLDKELKEWREEAKAQGLDDVRWQVFLPKVEEIRRDAANWWAHGAEHPKEAYRRMDELKKSARKLIDSVRTARSKINPEDIPEGMVRRTLLDYNILEGRDEWDWLDVEDARIVVDIIVSDDFLDNPVRFQVVREKAAETASTYREAAQNAVKKAWTLLEPKMEAPQDHTDEIQEVISFLQSNLEDLTDDAIDAATNTAMVSLQEMQKDDTARAQWKWSFAKKTIIGTLSLTFSTVRLVFSGGLDGSAWWFAIAALASLTEQIYDACRSVNSVYAQLKKQITGLEADLKAAGDKLKGLKVTGKNTLSVLLKTAGLPPDLTGMMFKTVGNIDTTTRLLRSKVSGVDIQSNDLLTKYETLLTESQALHEKMVQAADEGRLDLKKARQFDKIVKKLEKKFDEIGNLQQDLKEVREFLLEVEDISRRHKQAFSRRILNFFDGVDNGKMISLGDASYLFYDACIAEELINGTTKLDGAWAFMRDDLLITGLKEAADFGKALIV